ncbi:hypothetical protein [Aquimarina agarilytica]|uniref:hypothetical protein n=1 Tax=Aquimarina agarilytica TaxID=1087449 RepID=UPI0002DAD030|nr:hypothetical protein [Aquimarina agarilytica]
MKEAEIKTPVRVTDALQEDQVKKAFELMVVNFRAEGIIKMAQLFKTDPFVRSIVKRKLS